MKLTLLWLSAAAATVSALVFWVYAQQPQEQRPGSSTEITTTESNSLATEAPVEVSNSSITIVGEGETVEAAALELGEPAFVGDAFETGVELYQEGEFAAAVEALEWAVRQEEDHPYRHYLLGLAYRKAGIPEGAVEEFERSLELAPGQIRAHVNLARARLDLNQVDEARMAVDSALELDLDDPDAWNLLGRVELGSSQLEAAATAFMKCTARDSTHAYAWNNLGYVRIQQGRFFDGLAPLERAIQCGVEEAYFYNNLAVVYEQLDRLDDATIAYERATELGHGPAEESLERVVEVATARAEEPEEVEATLAASN